MKRKNYKVEVKLIFTTTMDHSQTSMKKAKSEVEMVVNDYIKNGLDIRKIFDKTPHIISKVTKYDSK